jgi:hypothetical protein
MGGTGSTVSNKSYGQRIMDSLAGFVIGLVLLCVGPVLLMWNEHRHVLKIKQLAICEGKAVTVDPFDPEDGRTYPQTCCGLFKAKPDTDGDLVYLSGVVSSDGEKLADPIIPVVAVQNFSRLHRVCRIYQYVQTKTEKREDELGGGQKTTTSYSVKEVWVKSPQPDPVVSHVQHSH